jgi:hypothetical protein
MQQLEDAPAEILAYDQGTNGAFHGGAQALEVIQGFEDALFCIRIDIKELALRE